MNQTAHVLVVDDHKDLRESLSRELASNGYRISTASDGDEAQDLLNREKVDLVILDVKMPRVSGFEVLKWVKQHHPLVKVLMLTAFADLRNALESKKLGADDFVSKPYELEDLLSTVQRLLAV